MNDQQNRWPQVAAAIADAMAAKGWGQADLIRASGVSDYTVRRLQNGEPGNYRPNILAKVSTALWGDPSRIRRILDGESGGEARDQDQGDDGVVAAILASSRLDDTGKNALVAAYESFVTATVVKRAQHG